MLGGGISLGKVLDWGVCLLFYINNEKDVIVVGEKWVREIVERNTMRKVMGVILYLVLYVIIWNLFFIGEKWGITGGFWVKEW